jgi:hypothetical protein
MIQYPFILPWSCQRPLALTSDKRLFLAMVLDDHRTKSLEQAEAYIEDFLSQPFNREMSENMER